MNGSPVSVRNYSYMYSGGKGAATQQAQRILEIPESITRHLIITRSTGDEGMNENCRSLSIGVDGGRESKK